ncbi:hypothetical protein AAMO2058_000611100 [Amorphochlora amoebiformis]
MTDGKGEYAKMPGKEESKGDFLQVGSPSKTSTMSVLSRDDSADGVPQIGKEQSDPAKELVLWQRRTMISSSILLTVVCFLLSAIALGSDLKIRALRIQIGDVKTIMHDMNNALLELKNNTGIMEQTIKSVDTHMLTVEYLTRALSSKMDILRVSIDNTSMEIRTADKHALNIVYNTYELCKIIHILDPDKRKPACFDTIGY